MSPKINFKKESMCSFCKKNGYMKKQYAKFHKWLENKDTPISFVCCYESNIDISLRQRAYLMLAMETLVKLEAKLVLVRGLVNTFPSLFRSHFFFLVVGWEDDNITGNGVEKKMLFLLLGGRSFTIVTALRCWGCPSVGPKRGDMMLWL